MTREGRKQEPERTDTGSIFLSPSFDDEPEVELIDPVDDDELTDDNHPLSRD
jgi:hypothetical protein